MNQSYRWNQALALLLVVLALTAAAFAGKGNGHDKGKDKDKGKDEHGRAGQAADHRNHGNAPPARRDYHMGNRVQIQCAHRTKKNTTYVPVRAPFEQMGARVEWREREQQARIVYRDRTICCTPGSRTVYIIERGRQWTEVWEQAPTYYGGQLYVPMRPVFSGLGVPVNYQAGAVTIGAGFFFGLS